MARYRVRRFYSSYVDTFVEADDEGEAKAVVEQMSINTDEIVENRLDWDSGYAVEY